MPKILGFSGKICSGKDTVVNKLVEKLIDGKKPVHKLAYADALRGELGRIISIMKENGGDCVKETSVKVAEEMGVSIDEASKAVSLIVEASEASPSVSAYDRTDEIRQLLQFWGTDVRRKNNPDYWVEETFKRIGEYSADTVVILTDCRFPNEVEAILSKGGMVARLLVSEPEQLRRMKLRDGLEDTSRFKHFSEVALDNYHFKNAYDTERKSADEIAKEIYNSLGF